MIKYLHGDMFETGADGLVNTVNTVGVMGKGIAKTFKQIYPDMYKSYKKLCDENRLEIGNLLVYKTENKTVINFPTRKHWRTKSKVEWIEEGLKTFIKIYDELNVSSVAFPRLGCGNGGLDWDEEVKPLMVKYLQNIDIDIYIYIGKYNDPKEEYFELEDVSERLNNLENILSYDLFKQDIISNIDRYYRNENLVNKSIKWSNEGIVAGDVSVDEMDIISLFSIIKELRYYEEDIIPFEYSDIEAKLFFRLFEFSGFMKKIIIDEKIKAFQLVVPSKSKKDEIDLVLHSDVNSSQLSMDI